jgi:hypothetical protein
LLQLRKHGKPSIHCTKTFKLVTWDRGSTSSVWTANFSPDIDSACEQLIHTNFWSVISELWLISLTRIFVFLAPIATLSNHFAALLCWQVTFRRAFSLQLQNNQQDQLRWDNLWRIYLSFVESKYISHYLEIYNCLFGVSNTAWKIFNVFSCKEKSVQYEMFLLSSPTNIIR